MGFVEGMAVFVLSKAPNGKRCFSKGKVHTCRAGEDTSFYSGIMEKKVNIIHDVRTGSNWRSWGLALI